MYTMNCSAFTNSATLSDLRLQVVRVCSDPPSGRSIEESFVAVDGAIYSAQWVLTRRLPDGRWVYLLSQVTEVMPPRTPQASDYNQDTRLPMMSADGCVNVLLEAAQRRKEWDTMSALAVGLPACPEEPMLITDKRARTLGVDGVGFGARLAESHGTEPSGPEGIASLCTKLMALTLKKPMTP